ncbi:MAG: DUF1295 domain-containing protein [Planctomycetales bacterium]|nr:DUF1295 domain-containing protein [Planctomycetales bacterium]
MISAHRCAREFVAHLAHAILLVAPTILLVDLRSIGWKIGCFTLMTMVAAALESRLVARHLPSGWESIEDPLAMRVAAMVGIGLLAVFWSAQIERVICAPAPGAHTLSMIGVAVMFTGIVLRVVAIRTLGPSFVSDIRCSGIYIQTGVYAWLRHPAEIGMLLLAIGAPMLLMAPRTALAAALLLGPVSVWRMRREDALLLHRVETS